MIGNPSSALNLIKHKNLNFNRDRCDDDPRLDRVGKYGDRDQSARVNVQNGPIMLCDIKSNFSTALGHYSLYTDDSH